MNPAFIWYWKRRCAGDASCGTYAGAGEWGSQAREGRHGSAEAFHFSSRHHDPVFGSAGVGVRRPLRFFSFRLDLSERQIGEVAKILEGLKIERAQAEVDLRRAASDLADALESAEFGRTSSDSARSRRMEAARRVQDSVSTAVERLHELLDAEQREELARLVRSGAIKI